MRQSRENAPLTPGSGYGNAAVRTPAQRGRIGNWLRDERLARGWSQKVARNNLSAAGVPVAESVYAEWESGTRVPNDRNLARLEEFFGPVTENPADATPAGFSDLLALQRQLVDAFEVQAQAVMALVDEIRLDRADETEDLRARVRVLEATVRALHPELEVLEPSTPTVPRATGGSGRAEAGA